jgi:hypothetical protein
VSCSTFPVSLYRFALESFVCPVLLTAVYQWSQSRLIVLALSDVPICSGHTASKCVPRPFPNSHVSQVMCNSGTLPYAWRIYHPSHLVANLNIYCVGFINHSPQSYWKSKLMQRNSLLLVVRRLLWALSLLYQIPWRVLLFREIGSLGSIRIIWNWSGLDVSP